MRLPRRGDVEDRGAFAAVDWETLRHVLVCRSGSACEVCGRPLTDRSWQAHHRQPRGMGGTSDPYVNSPCRLVTAHERCHAWVESSRDAALSRGLLVPQGQDTRTVPLVLPGGRRVLLDDNGLYLPADLPVYAATVPLPGTTGLYT